MDMIKLQLCTAVIDVPADKAPAWEAKGYKRIKEREKFVPPPPREEGKAVIE